MNEKPKPFPNCEECEHLVFGICSIPIKDDGITCPKDEWHKMFVAWLQSQQLPRIIDAIAELVDDRSDFQKGYKIGYVDALKKVLEAMGEK